MIGIVGGVGPYAGLDLLRKVYDHTIAGKDQDHLDTILISMPGSIMDRTGYLEGKVTENPGHAIASVIQKLEMAGATVAGIPCNTAHVEEIFNLIERELNAEGCSIRVVHMIGETMKFIKMFYPGLVRIGVLSTTGTYRNNLYHQSLELSGFEVVKPSEEMQRELIHPAIYHPLYGIKSVSGPVQPQALRNLEKGLHVLKEQGAGAVILGCTEIPLVFPGPEVMGMVAIDPAMVLARALIQETSPEKLKPYRSIK